MVPPGAGQTQPRSRHRPHPHHPARHTAHNSLNLLPPAVVGATSSVNLRKGVGAAVGLGGGKRAMSQMTRMTMTTPTTTSTGVYRFMKLLPLKASRSIGSFSTTGRDSPDGAGAGSGAGTSATAGAGMGSALGASGAVSVAL